MKKALKDCIIFAVIHFVFQYGSVNLFNQMLTLSEQHNIETVSLAKYQSWIMAAIFIALVAASVLFLAFLLGMVRNVWRDPKEVESQG
ncbi:hypothetical protein ABES02_28660 [Neobacillus pocheonensis]|uniref:hypothetical protein n=1 Tax=Neobacillus pocheonensis TaxID=363869 RepID=UPI003D2BB565